MKLSKITNEEDFKKKFKEDFFNDVEAQKLNHQKMNYSYLQYKGILYFNNLYGQDYLKSVGLQINVPRTFMTIESIRSVTNRSKFDFELEPVSKREYQNVKKARAFLKGEWKRSDADNDKNEAFADSLLYGTGYLFDSFVDEKKEGMLYDSRDEKTNEIIYKKGVYQTYKGYKLRSLNPYYVFRDRDATSEKNWNHCYIYSIWDLDEFKERAELNGWNTEDLIKGGHLEEYDWVRRQIDAIYSYSVRQRDGTQLITGVPPESKKMDFANKIGVIERYEEDLFVIMAGGNWTKCVQDYNPRPKKEIPIHPIRDYWLNGEFEGIGEPEAIRWQQYEENKIHNLSFLSTLMNTIQRYGIVEDLLVDPTEARISNPFKPIRLKNVMGNDISKALMPLNQRSPNIYPKDFLAEIKQIGQSTTGISDFYIGSSKAITETATEANKLSSATEIRIARKISDMAQRSLKPILQSWLAGAPVFYDDELDYLLTDEHNMWVKYLPYDREMNDDIDMVSEISVKTGVLKEEVKTIEDIYLALGYQQVVFASDLCGSYDIFIKVADIEGDRQVKLQQFRLAIETMKMINDSQPPQGMTPDGKPIMPKPIFDLAKLGKEQLRQFPEIISDPDDYMIKEEQQTQIPNTNTNTNPTMVG